jgi:hypothetical protein
MVLKKKSHRNSHKSNHKKRVSSTKWKTITRKKYQKMEYPYFYQTLTKKELLELFEKFKTYKPKILARNPTKNKIKKFRGKMIIFKEEYLQLADFYNITDYFAQKCRVQCLYNLRNSKTPLEYFTENKDEIYNQIMEKKGTVEHLDLTEYLWSKTKFCTLFNNTVVLSLLKLLKPKRYLDPSAGWGDRLVGAIAYGCEYTGVDPSECMNPIYKKIIQTLVPKEKRGNYQIIQDGYEKTEIKENYYDLVFTSPPFFDLEVYEKKEGQSIMHFNSLERWINGFLFPSIIKSSLALVKGGYFALYVNDFPNAKYVDRMEKFIKESIIDLQEAGQIHFWTKDNPKVIRTIRLWKKV